jgi:excisionase family DNA binding protein
VAKRNTIAKVGKRVVSFGGDSAAVTVQASEPEEQRAPEAKARGPPVDPLLTVQEVAEVLRCSVSAMNKWRLIGSGPRFVYVGTRVRYRRADVLAYVAARTRTSTSSEVSPVPP